MLRIIVIKLYDLWEKIIKKKIIINCDTPAVDSKKMTTVAQRSSIGSDYEFQIFHHFIIEY